MKKITDRSKREHYIIQNGIRNIFETKDLDFQLYQYDRGELISNLTDLSNTLLFLVEGSVQIYALEPEGNKYTICQVEPFLLLGDMEFAENNDTAYLVEAATEVHCIALPIHRLRETLQKDNTFLLFLLRSITRKFILFSKSETSALSLEEKLILYMEIDSRDRTFHGVEKAANHLHYSRRQLQRILKDMMERGKITKIARGTYHLN